MKHRETLYVALRNRDDLNTKPWFGLDTFGWTSREARKEAEHFFGEKWKDMYRRGWRIVKVRVTEL